jgi:uncharacterized protein (DUF2147 family)
MSKVFVLFCYFLLAMQSFAIAQNQILGKWQTENKKAIVEIYEKEGIYYGKIVWLKTPNDSKGKPLKDIYNPNKKKRTNSIMGLVILNGFIYSEKEWKGGTVYNPESGETYSCKMWLLDNNTLKGRGYLGVLFSTQKWTRVQ